jgi:hypothetical protein
MRRVKASPAAAPITTPTPVNARACDATSRNTWDPSAPSAIRSSSSRVKRDPVVRKYPGLTWLYSASGRSSGAGS